MKTYITLIAISGLKRADRSIERKPIAEGEVIELPDGFATSLLGSEAIAPSDADVTVELHWDSPVELIKSNDAIALRDALIALDPDFGREPDQTELQVIGMDVAKGPDMTALQVIGIAPTDYEALAQALEAAGAVVVLAGEDWASSLHKVDKAPLLSEVARRIAYQGILVSDLPEEVLGLAGIALSASLQDLTGKPDPVIVAEARVVTEKAEAAVQQAEQQVPAPVDPVPVEPAPAKTVKPARKRA